MNTLHITLAVLWCFLQFGAPMPEARAQKANRPVDSLRVLHMQIDQLYNVLDKIDRKDFDFTHMRAWWIGDAGLEDTLRWVYTRMTGDSTLFGGEVEGKAPFYVLATPPPNNDIVVLYSGNNILKGKQLRALLSAKPDGELYERVVSSWKYGQEIELIDKDLVIRNGFTFRQMSRGDSIYSLFNGFLVGNNNHDTATVITLRLLESVGIRFSDQLGIEARLGNDDFGYSFWSSGNAAFLVNYKRAKIGVHVPFAGGRTPGRVLDPFWTPRRIDGTYGITGEFDFVNFGGSFIAGLRRTDVNGTYVRPDSITTIRNMVQLWYSDVINDKPDANLFRYKVGVGFHQIGHDALFNSGGTKPLSVETTEPPTSYVSPYIKLEYVNRQSAKRFGGSLQYYNQWVLGDAWLEVIPNRLRLELKTGAPVFRKHKPWESTHFLMLVVPITFNL